MKFEAFVIKIVIKINFSEVFGELGSISEQLFQICLSVETFRWFLCEIAGHFLSSGPFWSPNPHPSGLTCIPRHWTYLCGQYESQCESQWQSPNVEILVVWPISIMISTIIVIFIKICIWTHKLMDLKADISAFDDLTML